jgi:hypothetical protein
MERMTLEPGRWYGWTMYPGYLDRPYHSPIKVLGVRALGTGRGLFDLEFHNLAYAEGVRNMGYRLRTLRRERHHIIAAEDESDRSVVIVPLGMVWIDIHAASLKDQLVGLVEQGLSLDQAMDRIAFSG